MFKLLNKADWFVIVTTVILSVGLYFSFQYFYGASSGKVNIYYDNKLVATLDLNINETVLLEKNRYPQLLDDLEVEVKDGQVRISKETSPNNICSKQGWTSSPINPLVCLPNKVYVQIESADETDNGVDAVVQ